MTNTPPLRLALIAAALALSSCAGSSDKYPSLAIRDAERVTGQFTPSAPAAEPVAPVTSAQDLAAILQNAGEAHRQFVSAQGGTQQLVRSARGAGPDSSIRSRALVALADLTSLRSQTVLALAKLDALESEASTTFAPIDAIRAAQAEVALLVGEQDAAIDSLSAQLR